MVLVALAGLPSVVAQLAPSTAPYIPPFMLSAVAAFTVAEALLAWRTQWVVEQLFPGRQLPTPLPFSAEERRNAAVSAYAGLLVSSTLAIIWLRSLP